MNYKDLKQLISLFANTENILKSNWIDITRIICELKQLNKVCESKENVYFTSVQEQDREITRKIDGKTFHFAKNILLSHTDILSKKKASEVLEYSGRAKKLWECPKMLYKACMDYFNKWLYSKGEDLWKIKKSF